MDSKRKKRKTKKRNNEEGTQRNREKWRIESFLRKKYNNQINKKLSFRIGLWKDIKDIKLNIEIISRRDKGDGRKRPTEL